MKKLVLAALVFLWLTVPVLAEDDWARDMTQTSVEVTNAASTIVAADGGYGKYVWIQNNDAAGIVYLKLGGTATASTTMITLEPGDSVNFGRIINYVSAIGSIASNANVVVITW